MFFFIIEEKFCEFPMTEMSPKTHKDPSVLILAHYGSNLIKKL